MCRPNDQATKTTCIRVWCAQRWRDWARLSARVPRLEEVAAKHQQALSGKNEELDKAKVEQEEVRKCR